MKTTIHDGKLHVCVDDLIALLTKENKRGRWNSDNRAYRSIISRLNNLKNSATPKERETPSPLQIGDKVRLTKERLALLKDQAATYKGLQPWVWLNYNENTIGTVVDSTDILFPKPYRPLNQDVHIKVGNDITSWSMSSLEKIASADDIQQDVRSYVDDGRQYLRNNPGINPDNPKTLYETATNLLR